FRAEPMELRHLLPVNKAAIYSDIRWTITDRLDKIVDPQTGQSLWVDVDYYILDHYRCPLTREAWVENRIINLNKGADDPKTVQEFIDNSVQFEYNDPATLEFYLPSLSDNARVMGRLNRAGYGMGI
ncbi:MAG: hypothetical protein AAF203_04700, partial [Pseudomonadota bacterium]